MKYIPVNGISFTNDFSIHWFDIHGNIMTFTFLSRNGFDKEHKKLMNYSEKDEYDTVVKFESQNNNSYEVQSIKSLLSLLHIVDRIENTNKRFKNFKRDFKVEIDEKILRLMFEEKEGDFWKNEYLNEGYFDNEDNILSNVWNVNIGNTRINNNYFERYATRYFDEDCIDEFNRQANVEFRNKKVLIEQEHVEKYTDIFELIYSGKETYKKIKAVSYLYYDLLNLKQNYSYSVITIATIFETLLLKNNESNQRKKVAVRAACILGNGQKKERKTYIANGIYYFYKYRNGIVHDGNSIIDFDEEIVFDTLASRMKTIIYCIIKFYIDNQIESINEVIDIVKKNMLKDALDTAFEYITISDEGMRLSSEILVFDEYK